MPSKISKAIGQNLRLIIFLASFNGKPTPSHWAVEWLDDIKNFVLPRARASTIATMAGLIIDKRTLILQSRRRLFGGDDELQSCYITRYSGS